MGHHYTIYHLNYITLYMIVSKQIASVSVMEIPQMNVIVLTEQAM